MDVKHILSSTVISGLIAGLFSFNNVAMAVTVDADNAAVGAEPIVSNTSQYPEVDGKRIIINLANRGLYLYENGIKTHLYPIAAGKVATPTPVGYYRIVDKEYNPTWTDPTTLKSIPSGPDCPLGYRWIGIHGNYGIHGTNNEASISSYASNGCIRMYESNVEELFELVPMYTPVDITYNRVVVEKDYEDNVVYYVYPDAYGWQSLDNEDVNVWLRGFGVYDFVSEEDVAKKIEESDGNPTFVAKTYELQLNGKKINGNAVVYEHITYLPAVPIAIATKTDVGTDGNIFVSKYGKCASYNFKDNYYLNADDVETLFGIQGDFENSVYNLMTTNKEANNIVVVEPANVVIKDDAVTEENNADNEVKDNMVETVKGTISSIQKLEKSDSEINTVETKAVDAVQE